MLPDDRPDPAATPVAPSVEPPAPRSGARGGATGATKSVQGSAAQKGSKPVQRAAAGLAGATKPVKRAASVRTGRASPAVVRRVHRAAAVAAAQVGCALPDADALPHLLAREGKWALLLRPAAGGGYAYALAYWQIARRGWWVPFASPDLGSVLSFLVHEECRHGYSVNLYAAASTYPPDASRLSADDVAALPFGMEWVG